MMLEGKRVLIVEDDNIIAMDLAYDVGASGAKVVGTVGSVDAALAVIASTDLDGVVLDINLRGRTGFLVADTLAARRIPFVFATGYMKSCEVLTRHYNAPCLEKPFSRGALWYALEDVMCPEAPRNR
jgi:CheY-like chemotaxis protein